jgi:nucleotide-binding universal stress UspA family protein
MRAIPQRSAFVYSTLESHGAVAQAVADEPSLAGRTIVVATDGSHESRAATAVASVLGRRHGATTVALRAYDYSTPTDRAEVLVAPWGRSYDTLDLARQLLRQEINRDIAEVETWNVRAVAGRPAHAIAAEARALDAALVVMGLRRARDGEVPPHDTVMQVMRESSAPVLVTTGALAGAPRRIVVGVDFGLESVRVARAALAVLDDDGALVLANVQGGSQPSGRMQRRAGTLADEGAAASLERLRRALPPWSNVSLVVLHERDDVATSLLAAAVRLRADCVAVGTRPRALDDGAKLGIVATALVKSGMRSLLVVPHALRGGAASVSTGHGS